MRGGRKTIIRSKCAVFYINTVWYSANWETCNNLEKSVNLVSDPHPEIVFSFVHEASDSLLEECLGRFVSAVGCSICAIGGDTVVCGLLVGNALLPALELNILLSVVVDVQTKVSRVDVAVAPDEKSAEDRFGENVENTVEDSLRVGRDEVGTLTNRPGNRVENPQKGSQRSADEERPAHVRAHGVGVSASLPDEDVNDPEKGGATESEVAPLISRLDESTSQAGDDHDFVNQDQEKGCGPWHASGKEQVHQQQRGGDDPIDVPLIFHCQRLSDICPRENIRTT